MISKMTTLLFGLQILVVIVSHCMAANTTKAKGENRVPNYHQRHPSFQGTKTLPGLESVLGVMGPLALAAMVSLPFVAPAAAALIPLASISGVFGRRRRHLDNFSRRVPITDAEDLMRRIYTAATRRDIML